MVITDLDGTLLSNDYKVSPTDLNTLKILGENNIIRVIATGRSPFSLRTVLAENFPVDYIIFSSGAGIIDWQKNKYILSNEITAGKVQQIANYLIQENFDFMIQNPIPENHRFVYHSTGNKNPDFVRRCKLYHKFCVPLTLFPKNFGSACQIIAITPEQPSIYYRLCDKFHEFKVIRATSPLDGKSIWIEFFPKNVSKGHAAEWLCNYLGINQYDTMGIGNDFNDLDFLALDKAEFRG